MKQVKNVFGEGILYNENDLKGKIYATSAACMSVWSDFLSWANANPNRMTNDPFNADTIVVLGCQVTDLAVLNDLEIARKLHKETKRDIYMGGCLSQRMDIRLPEYLKRLDVVRSIGQDIYNRELIDYEKPFWVPNFEENKEELKEGNLFRNFYPLKIGAGCHGKCSYCTIRHTRGETYELLPDSQIKEFLDHENVVLISDSPTVNQINAWCNVALNTNKQISIRNVEPQVLIQCKEKLNEVATKGLLHILHCPIQSLNDEIIKIMNRSVKATKEAIEYMQELRKLGVIVATNIIIDYIHEGKVYENHDIEYLNKMFDYYSWNPYFDGNFDLQKAEERFCKYIKK